MMQVEPIHWNWAFCTTNFKTTVTKTFRAFLIGECTNYNINAYWTVVLLNLMKPIIFYFISGRIYVFPPFFWIFLTSSLSFNPFHFCVYKVCFFYFVFKHLLWKQWAGKLQTRYFEFEKAETTWKIVTWILFYIMQCLHIVNWWIAIDAW